MAGNIVLGGLIGAAVDAGSGAMKELKPNPIVVKLVPLETEAVEAPRATGGDQPQQEQPLAVTDDMAEQQQPKAQDVSLLLKLEPISADEAILVIEEA
jgi:hypothetical protein